MKKYLSIAALLAAGTLVSNAVVLSDALYTSTGSTITAVPGKTISGDFSFTLVFNADAIKGVLGKSDVDRVTLAYITGAQSIALATALNNTGFVGLARGNLDTPNDTESRYPMTSNGSTPATNNFADSDVSGNLVSKLSTLTNLALTLSHDNGTSSSLYVSLSFSDGSTSEQLYGTSDSLKWTQSGGFGTFSELKFHSTYVSQAYVFDSAVSQTDAFSINSSAVPEPSAFGLLAGLGALALVASRRRRK